MRTRTKGKGPRGEILDENGNIRRTQKSIVKAAKNLREQMTHPEKILWGKLRGKKLAGLKFYRQKPIDRFVVDFYCPEKKLIVEVDGNIHDAKDVADYDKNREKQLRRKGLRILRIRNEDVEKNLDATCELILKKAQARIT